jgi:thioredoxin 1
MSKLLMAAVAAAVLVGGAVVVRGGERALAPATTQAPSGKAVPRLVDLGSVGCIPCKAMAPILEGLKVEYAGRMEVEFIDVWKNRDAADAYGVRMIPTQVFFGADGQELARHQGFMGKDEILAQWKAVGVSF